MDEVIRKTFEEFPSSTHHRGTRPDIKNAEPAEEEHEPALLQACCSNCNICFVVLKLKVFQVTQQLFLSVFVSSCSSWLVRFFFRSTWIVSNMGMQFSQVIHFHFCQLFWKFGGVSTKALYLFSASLHVCIYVYVATTTALRLIPTTTNQPRTVQPFHTVLHLEEKDLALDTWNHWTGSHPHWG